MDQTISRVEVLLSQLLDGTTFFVIDIRIKPTNNIKVYLDGDHGITINDISKLNKALYKQIEEAAWYPEGDFSLEVSSPGIDEPLKFIRQYKKNIGRTILISFSDLGTTPVEGVLKSISDDETTIALEVTEGKKKEVSIKEFPLTSIQSAIIQIKF